MKRSKLRTTFSYRIFSSLNVFLLLFFAFCALYPLYNVFIYAFNDGIDSLKAPLFFYPRSPSLNNMAIALKTRGILDAYKISILRTVIGTALAVPLTASLAFALTKTKLPGHGFFSTFFFITFMFNGGFIAFFLTIRELGLYNKFLVYILPALYNYWHMIIIRSFFMRMPHSIEESAELDGASQLTIFARLILPMSKPVLAAIALFTAVAHWNDWFVGTFYIKSQKLIPIQTLLKKMLTELTVLTNMAAMGEEGAKYLEGITPNGIRMAIVVLTVTPIIMVYPFLQKYFIKGIMIGAVKG